MGDAWVTYGRRVAEGAVGYGVVQGWLVVGVRGEDTSRPIKTPRAPRPKVRLKRLTCMAGAWVTHGRRMAQTWQVCGWRMADAWLAHGCAWLAHGRQVRAHG